jgi:hypothetical protein
MAGFKATWLGDTDPGAQIIYMGDLRFIKGEPTSVPANHEFAEMIKGNPTFSHEGKAEPVEAVEPSEDEQMAAAEQGTVKGNLKAQLKLRGVEVKGNPSEETLRSKLAEATKDETSPPAIGNMVR